jgi:glycosyltransferase involved in cell wall biosynthesis
MAVFAHNESGRIGKALESIARASGGKDVEIHVLVNGCTDSTADEVRACAGTISHVWLVEIDRGDKANAWNVFVHDILTPERRREIELHFFMDGDVTLEPDALPRLASAFAEVPSASAAGGMPATGRDRDAWRVRMVENGVIAGNLYALRPSFVRELRERNLRMPVGLIGEDLFLSWLLASDVWKGKKPLDGPPCVFHAGAEFSFRSLSPLRVGDYRTYARRKWRYTRRALQLEMLVGLLKERGLAAMPANVEGLYLDAPLPSRLRWVGWDTPLRTLAVLWMRSLRKRRVNAVRLR